MSPWSEGLGLFLAREGEAASGSERWKGEVSSPSKLTWGKTDGINQVSFRKIRMMPARPLKKAGGNTGKAGVFIERMDCQ